MQRVFKATDPKDVKELFELLPDNIVKISRKTFEIIGGIKTKRRIFLSNKEGDTASLDLLHIDWDGLTEIHRPTSYEKYIGKLGYFTDSDRRAWTLSLLREVNDGKFMAHHGVTFSNFRPLTLEEAKELIYE